MATPISKQRPTSAETSLDANIAWLRKRRAELEAEHGDLEAYVDRFAEEMFGSSEAASVLIEYVLRAAGELDPEDDSDRDGDGW